MKKITIFFIGTIVGVIIVIAPATAYFFCNRVVKYKLECVVNKPDISFDMSDYSEGISLISSEELLFYFLHNRLESHGIPSYDSTQIEEISQRFCFSEYDYLMSYHRPIKRIVYSPYSTLKEYLDYPWADGIPLIHTMDTTICSDSIYFYSVRPKGKYRVLFP